MGKFDDLKKLRHAVVDKLATGEVADKLKSTAVDAVTGAAGVVESVEAVAERSGLTNKEGEISKLKVAKAAFRPAKTARTLLDATAEELRARGKDGDEPSS